MNKEELWDTLNSPLTRDCMNCEYRVGLGCGNKLFVKDHIGESGCESAINPACRPDSGSPDLWKWDGIK